MRDETEIAILASAENGEKYDASCKDLWKHKEMLAPLLRFLVEEYAGMTDDEIIACIDADTISDKDLVDDIPPTVVDRGTEYSSITDKLISYDLHFKAKNPKLSKEDNNRQILVMVHFDLEFQTKYKVTNPEYPIIKRAIYYGARGLSSQLGPLTQKTNYAALEKAYSI